MQLDKKKHSDTTGTKSETRDKRTHARMAPEPHVIAAVVHHYNVGVAKVRIDEAVRREHACGPEVVRADVAAHKKRVLCPLAARGVVVAQVPALTWPHICTCFYQGPRGAQGQSRTHHKQRVDTPCNAKRAHDVAPEGQSPSESTLDFAG